MLSGRSGGWCDNQSFAAALPGHQSSLGAVLPKGFGSQPLKRPFSHPPLNSFLATPVTDFVPFMSQVWKQVRLEKLFPYHVSQIELLYGEEKCRSYVKEANDWLVSFMWLHIAGTRVMSMRLNGSRERIYDCMAAPEFSADEANTNFFDDEISDATQLT